MIRLSIFDHYYATYYKYEFLTKCEVKKTGYWPSSFFRAYGQRWSRGPLKRKKKNNDAKTQSSNNHTSLLRQRIY